MIKFLLGALVAWLLITNPTLPSHLGETAANILDAVTTAIKAAKSTGAVG